MYRPKEFNNPYSPDGEDDEIYCDIGKRDMGIFETGADALLKALLSKGIHTEKGEWIEVRGGILEDDDSVPVAGTWVFIPDKEE